MTRRTAPTAPAAVIALLEAVGRAEDPRARAAFAAAALLGVCSGRYPSPRSREACAAWIEQASERDVAEVLARAERQLERVKQLETRRPGACSLCATRRGRLAWSSSRCGFVCAVCAPPSEGRRPGRGEARGRGSSVGPRHLAAVPHAGPP